jgi:hypothetical protein
MKSKNKIHLVLTHKYFNEIEKGVKTEEFRDYTEYYFDMFNKCTYFPFPLVLHKGYDTITVHRMIEKIEIIEDLYEDGSTDSYFKLTIRLPTDEEEKTLF